MRGRGASGWLGWDVSVTRPHEPRRAVQAMCVASRDGSGRPCLTGGWIGCGTAAGLLSEVVVGEDVQGAEDDRGLDPYSEVVLSGRFPPVR